MHSFGNKFFVAMLMSSIQRMVLSSLPARGGEYVSHTPVGMLPPPPLSLLLSLSGRYSDLVVVDEGRSLV